MRAVIGLSLAAALLASTARAGDEEGKPVDWRDVAKSEGLTPDEVERLAATKILVAGPEFNQVFQPYIDSWTTPTFVTSDAVLNAYHVLFEESVVRLERTQAARLPDVLRPMWDGIPSAARKFDLPPELLADVVRRAQVTVGTALRLLGAETPGAPDDVAKRIDAETARVARHEGRLLPEWLGEPDAGYPFIDYGRFEPRGFYVRDDRLKSYFRAVNWLQAVPLRMGKERELLTALLLATSLRRTSDEGPARAYDAFVGAWATVLGARGDAPLAPPRVLGDGPWTRESLLEVRALCEREWRERNGETSETPADVLHGAEPSMRVLPATTLPDGALFDLCCPPSSKAAYPTGLFVAAALGGGFARRAAVAGKDDATHRRLDEIFDDAPRFFPDVEAYEGVRDVDDPRPRTSLYRRYLHCVAALLDAPDRAAPPLFASEAWQAKSTNAVLAGWAQLRQTWMLQARESADYGSDERVVAGFVEPNPTFFARLGDLVAASADFFESRGAFDESLDRRELMWLLTDYAAFLRGPNRLKDANDLPPDSAHRVTLSGYVVRELGGTQQTSPSGAMRRTEKTIPGDLVVLDDAVARLAGVDPLPDKLAQCVRWNTPRFSETWRRLERMCGRLEAMAQKQLRGAPWTRDEAAYLRDFGHVLAKAMFYDGNSYKNPTDDAPRATSVYAWLGDGASPGYFHAAIARPRALYVLYPKDGREILCRGAVVPYREFVNERRLTDAEWRQMLDSKDAPPSPEWVVPITAPVRPTPK